jgi:hypothetical protein
MDGARTTGFAQKIRPHLKTAIRAAGVATASVRPGPDFLVIGAKRGGTTSFYFDLLQHPGVLRLFPPPLPILKADATKGVHYFDSNHTRGDRWYRSYMPSRAARFIAQRRTGVRPVAGEASPYYLFHPAAAERAHAAYPNARIIAILRDPVDRTHSHWKERRRAGVEELDFVQALEAEPGRLEGERDKLLSDPAYASYAWEQQSYATQSMYGEALKPWIEKFGRDKVHIEASEDYYRDPVAVLGNVDEFLGLPRRASSTGVVRNAAKGEALPVETRSVLEARFAADTQLLVELTGRTFPWA